MWFSSVLPAISFQKITSSRGWFGSKEEQPNIARWYLDFDIRLSQMMCGRKKKHGGRRVFIYLRL
jgi:hypothetical protein